MARLDHDRVTDLFAQATALPIARRGLFLDSTCVGEPELRREVEDLLAHADRASALFDDALQQILQPDPETIGPYQLLEPIGEGGMAIVYKAQQHRPIKRIVAVKLVKLGMDTRRFVARFESERQTLAMMDHPNVAKVHDAGATETGRPYFVMEYVPGEPILAYCDARKLNICQRLELFIPVCQAVEHAHRRGIIHRDLKNSNVLVSDVDGRPCPKVIDFGVAKVISERLPQSTVFTEQGQLIGTPGYMSPEQAERGALDVDTRSDVYSLGALLYELITGVPPFPSELWASASYERVLEIIRQTEPARPATRLTALPGDEGKRLAACRRTTVPSLASQLRSGLEAIVLKAMRKDREQRYRSTAELADDIRNHLEGRPLIAGPDSRWYRARQFLRRHKTGVAASAAMLMLLIGGIVATTWQAIRASRERDNAQATLEFLTNDVLSAATPDHIHDQRVRDQIIAAMITPAARQVSEKFKDRPLIEASVRSAIQTVLREIGRSDLALPHAEKALSIRRQILGENHPDTILALHNYATVLQHLGKNAEAEPLQKEALDRFRRAIGDDDPRTLEALNNYAVVLQALRRLDEAELLFKEALERYRRVRGDDHLDTLGALNNYAFALQSRGRNLEALALFEEVLARGPRVVGNDDPLMFHALNNQATVLFSLRRAAEAEPLSRQAMERSREVLGPEHPDAIKFLNNYAVILKALGRLPEAEPLFKQALESHRRVLGDDDPTTIASLSDYGDVLAALRRFDEAEPVLKQVLDQRRRVLGDDDPDTISSLNNDAAVLLSLGRAAEAEPLSQKAVSQANGSLGPNHPRTKACARILSNVLTALGRPDEAAAVRKQFSLPEPATRAASSTTKSAQ